MNIDVCGVKYNVFQIEEVDNDPSCLGLCIYRESVIQIKKVCQPNVRSKFWSMRCYMQCCMKLVMKNTMKNK